MDSIPLKRCTHCKQEFPATLEFFHANPTGRYGLRTQCKTCHNARQRELQATPLVHIPVPDGYKRCSKCKQIKPATREFFYADRDKFTSSCKSCKQVHRPPPGETKRCTNCGNEYPRNTEYFLPKKKESRDHLSSWCRFCYRQIYRTRNKTHYPTDIPEGYRRCFTCKKDLPATTAYFPVDSHNKRYGLKSRCKDCCRNRRIEHKEEFLLREQRQRDRHRDNKRAIERNREAQKRSVQGTSTPKQIQEQLKRQNYRCYYAACGFSKFPRTKENGKWKYTYEVEHTFPLSRIAGSDIPGNDISYLVLSCKSCNDRKGKKFPWEWPEGGRLL